MKKSDEPYVQVSVMKKLNDDNLTTCGRTFWTQKEKAVIGKIVKIEEDDGSWSTDWEIVQVYKTELPKSVVQDRSHDYTRQRKASDI